MSNVKGIENFESFPESTNTPHPTYGSGVTITEK
jgi:hypothetical protein